MDTDQKYELLVCGFENNPARCVYVNNFRLGGAKPWGGGRTTAVWHFSLNELRRAFPEMAINEASSTSAENQRLRKTLQSIADSSCCESCQEAAKWARAALEGNEFSGGERLSAPDGTSSASTRGQLRDTKSMTRTAPQPQPLSSDAIASILADAASRGVPFVRELFRLAAIGGLHEEQLPKSLPRRDGSLERAG